METTTRLIAQYRKLAIIHGESLDTRKANYALAKLGQIRCTLRDESPERGREILTLLDDENIHVRYSAAYDALSLEPEQGLRVLRELAAGPTGEVRWEAEMTLEQWDRDDLPLQPWRKNQ